MTVGKGFLLEYKAVGSDALPRQASSEAPPLNGANGLGFQEGMKTRGSDIERSEKCTSITCSG